MGDSLAHRTEPLLVKRMEIEDGPELAPKLNASVAAPPSACTRWCIGPYLTCRMSIPDNVNRTESPAAAHLVVSSFTSMSIKDKTELKSALVCVSKRTKKKALL
jgi:hypothetical protein